MLKFSSRIKIVYNNINSYIPKKQVINNFIEKNEIQCAMFVEAKIKEEQLITYRDWDIIKKIGNKTTNTRGGSIVQCHPSLKMGKENPPAINNRLNECLHFTIPFKGEKLHVFLVYIHPHSKIEETIFTKAAVYKYSIIIGDFNINKMKQKQLTKFLQNGVFSKYLTAPTFIMDNNPDSTPDLILYSSNLKNNLLDVELIPDLGSNHLGMMISLDLEEIPEEIPRKTIYKFHACKIKKVNREVLEFIKENDTMQIDEDYITNFNNTLSNSIKKNTPIAKYHMALHELPPYIINLIKLKRKMYREYLIQPQPEFKKKHQ